VTAGGASGKSGGHPRARLLTVVGARPQFIKAAMLSRALAARRGVEETLVHTGQHFDDEMSRVFFDELRIPAPARHLGIHGGGHGAMTGRMLAALEEVIREARPEAVVVYGDTNSTLAGALAAAKLGVPVAHVEAGLRSFNRRMPEEINRVLADHVSDLLFCPTRAAVANLEREGITAGVHALGDVMYDASLFAAAAARARSTILARLDLTPRRYAVATLHRQENTDDPKALAAALDYIAAEAARQPVMLPLHPRAKAAIAAAGVATGAIRLGPPLGYLDMHRLLAEAALVLTDSGGVQKEAYFHRVPCVTLRDETEWVETVACGWNRLWRSDAWLPRRDIDDYGEGHAADGIAARIVERYAGAP
jgi:UDP-GlcNAc3NAcA epimerase